MRFELSRIKILINKEKATVKSHIDEYNNLYPSNPITVKRKDGEEYIEDIDLINYLAFYYEKRAFDKQNAKNCLYTGLNITQSPLRTAKFYKSETDRLEEENINLKEEVKRLEEENKELKDTNSIYDDLDETELDIYKNAVNEIKDIIDSIK